MAQAAKLSIITLFFLIFTSTGFSGGFNFGSGNIGYKQKMAPHYKFGFPIRSNGRIQKHGLKFHRLWNHRKYSYRFLYDPRFVSFIGKQSEKIGEVKVNIIGGQGGEPNEHTGKKDKLISSPHIVTFHDTAPDESANQLNSSKRPGSIILIRGTNISEVQTASD